MVAKKEKKDNLIKRALQGRMISYEFFIRHWYLVAGILALFIVFIANKYHCQTQLAEIMTLRKELNNAKTERVKYSSEYNSKIRETEMRHLIDTMRINLIMPEQPPFKIIGDETKE